MKQVSEFEARLLRILRVIMGRGSIDQVLAWLVRPIERPRCLSADCVMLAEEYLARGTTEFLARGGWRSERFLQQETVVSGRLWERHPTDAMSLRFSASSLELLIWLTAENFVKPARSLQIDPTTLTVGDQLLFARTFLAVQDTLGAPTLGRQPGFAEHGLLGLLAPFTTGLQATAGEPDIDFWCQPAQAWILESLQAAAAQAWRQAELRKRQLASHRDMLKIGGRQTQVLERLFAAAEARERRDLCVFLLQAAAGLLRETSPADWFAQLDVRSLRMAARTEVYDAALAFLNGLERLQQWNERARAVSFYDENYHSSQLWKTHWEQWQGERLRQQAVEIARHIDPVKAITGATP